MSGLRRKLTLYGTEKTRFDKKKDTFISLKTDRGENTPSSKASVPQNLNIQTLCCNACVRYRTMCKVHTEFKNTSK